MFPLVVLPAHYQTVLIPYETLAHGPAHIMTGSSEVEALAVSMPDIESSARTHDRIRSAEGVYEEFAKRRIFHVVILDGEVVGCAARVVDIVGRIRQEQVGFVAVHQQCHVSLGGAVAAHESMSAELVDVTALDRGRFGNRFIVIILNSGGCSIDG